jgi:hypothetical protein
VPPYLDICLTANDQRFYNLTTCTLAQYNPELTTLAAGLSTSGRSSLYYVPEQMEEQFRQDARKKMALQKGPMSHMMDHKKMVWIKFLVLTLDTASQGPQVGYDVCRRRTISQESHFLQRPYYPPITGLGPAPDDRNPRPEQE